MKFQKAIGVGLAVVMALSVAACSGNKTESGGNTSNNSGGTANNATANPSGASASAFEDGPLVPYEDTVDLSWGVSTWSVQQFFDGDTYEDNRWTRRIKDDLNINVTIKFSADQQTDAFRNKVNTLLASGDFPDLVCWNDPIWLTQAYESGYLADITDVYEKYATESVRKYDQLYPDCFEGVKHEGRMYGYPQIQDTFHQATYLWIRDDWLANTNSTAPKTMDEFLELAKKFTFEDPDKNGKDDTYGLAVDSKIMISNFGTLMGLANAYGVPGYGNPGTFFRGSDGKITYSWIQPGVKDALAVAHQMYVDGTIDPEFITKTTSNMEQDISSGRYGMMYHMNWGDWHPFNFSFEKDGVITRPYPIPTVKGIDYKMGIQSNQGGYTWVVSSKYKNPEAVIKVLNLFNKVTIDYTEEDEYLKYWDNEQYRLCPIQLAVPTELHAPTVFEAFKNNGATATGVARQTWQQTVDFEAGTNRGTSAYGIWGQMNLEGEWGGSMNIALNLYKPAGALITNILATDVPQTWQTNSSVLQTLYISTFTDIITGAKPLDTFDQFVQEWLNGGGQATLDEMEALYPNS